ncbi:hypothetical protein HP550_11620 [Cellulomonas humilata]|uniref:DUF4352 domain-containing protein n=1 Tax=Cellulomonas humilata TaxID=144055 RepID=A0A7Y6A3A7_9CELL|nr:hypothetical protein [Cellulomonas humilata]NUU17897.1 hypothetical protein [Cellulomonas humilata]
MPGPAAPPDLRARARQSGSTVARRVLDQPLRRIGIGGAVALLAVTAAFGGLQEQAQDGPEVLAVDAAVEVAPFELTVHRVVWTTDLPGQYLSEDGNRWVGVVATVRNTSDAGVLGVTLRDALTLTGVDGLVKEPGVLVPGVTSTSIALLEDGSSLSPVQPGLTYEAAFLFEQDGSVAPPTTATVLLQQHTWRKGSLDPTVTWWDPTTALRGELDVREAVSDADEEGDE